MGKMKAIFKNCLWKASGLIAALALLVTTANVNATCACSIHQPELPKNAGKLRKF